MTDQELAAALRRCGRVSGPGDCVACPFYKGDDPALCIPVMTSACADALENSESHVMALQQEIEKLRARLPRWIPVTEQLPLDARPVLAYYGFDNAGDGYLGMMFAGTLSYFCFDPCPHWQHESSGLVVTHWMHLPEPPKEAKEDG